MQCQVLTNSLLQSKGPIILKEETTRNFLACVLWVLKNIDKTLLKLWWTELGSARLQTMLEILRICISCFQYKVRTFMALDGLDNLHFHLWRQAAERSLWSVQLS